MPRGSGRTSHASSPGRRTTARHTNSHRGDAEAATTGPAPSPSAGPVSRANHWPVPSTTSSPSTTTGSPARHRRTAPSRWAGTAAGGIWIHVDHGGPTHACVSLSRTHMKQLLRALDPADHPVVVMGDADSLAR
ncbi:L,D-transpeptidase family protein [Streptomyces sp. NPDC002573]|uniref:L,D-transpeptidase family protein n=1 Tax=Streptomyces sp. NPDC002573 TaxID=3364651 RepID=UPI0036AEEFC7